MSKTIKMSLGKYIAVMMAFILVGAAVTGIPLLSQSKKYYDEKVQLENNLSAAEEQRDVANTNYFRLINEYNVTMKDRNTLLRAIERIDGDVPEWTILQCKQQVTEMPVDC